jgi:two-component system OmpR family sensor kinase
MGAFRPSTSDMSSRISIRGYRTGFLFVVSILALTAAFTVWRTTRTNQRVDSLVEHAFTRDELISRIRFSAASLEDSVDELINADTPDERKQSEDGITKTLDGIRQAREEYSKDPLPTGELEAWNKFNETSQALAKQVRTAMAFTKGKQPERARKHLEEEIKPVRDDLDQLSNDLTEKNAEETKRLLKYIELQRTRTALVGAGVLLAAVLISLVVAWRITALLRRQGTTIDEQLAELDRRNRELDAFASRVAHDLVGPLSPLKGYLTLIRRSKTISDGQVLEMIASAEAGASRMQDMVEALLRFCRAGTPSDVAVAELDTAVSTILTELAQVADKEKVHLERQLDTQVTVKCSAQLLQSIAQNLLSNAVKYTAGRTEPKVTVRVSKDRGEALLQVSDNGRGMSAESQRSLFQPFFRAPEARGLPGHGLGLATTKRLVEAHRGTISVQSELNVGTTVTVRFPLAMAAAPSMEARGPSNLEGAAAAS